MWDVTTQECRDLVEALEIAFTELQKVHARTEAAAAAQAAEGSQ
jgi:hypothetical protein